MKITFTSPATAKEQQGKPGDDIIKEVQVEMRHNKGVSKYVMGIEEARKRPCKARVVFSD